MIKHRVYSLHKVLLLWSALALLITTSLVSYFLLQTANTQFGASWENQIESDMHNLRLILQQQLSNNDWSAADKTLSHTATVPYVHNMSLLFDGVMRLSTSRQDIGQNNDIDFSLFNFDLNKHSFQVHHDNGHFHALMPLNVRSESAFRGHHDVWLFAHYDLHHQQDSALITTLQRVSLLVLVLFLYTAGLHRLAHRQVLRPLRSLVNFTRSLTTGGLGETVQGIGRTKEFAHLEKAFNQLSKYLQSSIKHIEFQANYDSLTNLSNRRFAMQTLEKMLAKARKDSRFGAALFIDLDHFKNINDSLGHPIGDRLLIEVSNRLRTTVSEQDMTARLGGDEFLVVLAPRNRTREDATQEAINLVNRVLQALHAPCVIDMHRLHISASIGIALYATDQVDAADIVRQADTAMYHAKSQGRNNYSLYTQSMQRETQEKLNLFNDLHLAIEQDAFSLVFQPQINQFNQITGAEVLCRWHHNGTYVRPDVFIAAAEETGLILPLGQWILRTSCQTLSRWQHEGILPQSFRRLAVNISPAQFMCTDFIDTLKSLLEEFDLRADQLELEITESIFVGNKNVVRDKMKQLSILGVSFSLDDFGTGYSSLSYLQHLPLNKLKIDRSFIMDIQSERPMVPLVDSIIQLGSNLNMDIIAEGVETEHQRQYLMTHNCHEFQGYLFSRPLPEAEFRAFLALQVSSEHEQSLSYSI